MKINIGAGRERLDGFLSADVSKIAKPDFVFNVEAGIPFPDNTFSEIRMHRILEHINPCSTRFVLNEIHRVAKPNCIWDIIVPFDNHYQRGMIDHKRGFTFHSFWALEQSTKMDTPEIKLRLKRISPLPHKLIRAFYYLFPNFYKKELHFRFEVIK